VLPPVVGAGRAWPGNARALSSRLRRGAAFLRRSGIEVQFERVGGHGLRVIRLMVLPNSRAAAIRQAAAKLTPASPLASRPSA
jgi:hypothetical protein